jgi:hypothetical protein
MDDETTYTCPSCGESITIAVDPSAGRRQDYVEDCQVCCRPNMIHLRLDEEGNVSSIVVMQE